MLGVPFGPCRPEFPESPVHPVRDLARRMYGIDRGQDSISVSTVVINQDHYRELIGFLPLSAPTLFRVGLCVSANFLGA